MHRRDQRPSFPLSLSFFSSSNRNIERPSKNPRCLSAPSPSPSPFASPSSPPFPSLAHDSPDTLSFFLFARRVARRYQGVSSGFASFLSYLREPEIKRQTSRSGCAGRTYRDMEERWRGLREIDRLTDIAGLSRPDRADRRPIRRPAVYICCSPP